jgi:hypothetical protein
MNTGKIEYDNETLYDMVSALAASDATISSYLPFCEALWQDVQNRVWLVAALMRKAGLLTLEPDEACVDFLAAKAIGDLGLTAEKVPVSKDELADALRAFIQLMPDEVWQQPTRLWGCLLKRLADEYGLKADVEGVTEVELPRDRAAELALFFIAAIGSQWNGDLDMRLESWKGRPEYEWLVAFRHSAKFDTMLKSVRRQVSTSFPLSDPYLFERLSEMMPFDRRGFLLLRNIETDQTIQAEIELEDATSTIRWRFCIQLKTRSKIGLYLRESSVGEMEISRQADGGIVVESASGICALLRTRGGQKLYVKKAAADESGSLIALTHMLKGSLTPLRDGKVLLLFEWRSPGVQV